MLDGLCAHVIYQVFLKCLLSTFFFLSFINISLLVIMFSFLVRFSEDFKITIDDNHAFLVPSITSIHMIDLELHILINSFIFKTSSYNFQIGV